MAVTRRGLCWYFQCTKGSDRKTIPGKYFPTRELSRKQAIDIICTHLVRSRPEHLQKFGGLVLDPQTVMLAIEEPDAKWH